MCQCGDPWKNRKTVLLWLVYILLSLLLVVVVEENFLAPKSRDRVFVVNSWRFVWLSSRLGMLIRG